jgi:uncharacterized protein DUF5701
MIHTPASMSSETEAEVNLSNEFDRQVETLLHKGYPELAELSQQEFLKHIEPLRPAITSRTMHGSPAEKGHIPFVIVIKHDRGATASAMSQVEVRKNRGVVNMFPAEPESFTPIEGLQIPRDIVYLLVDIDTGRDTLNITPADALTIIRQRNRSPLTIDEGVALVTHFPEVLTDKKTYNCFSMAGSRRSDRRVPALWISFGRPRLGWCWEGNPHTWLGSASCGSRVGSDHLVQ